MPVLLPSWPPDWPEIQAAAQHCLNSGDWGRYHSQTCHQLQLRLAQMFGVAQARLCCSGTAAVEIALRTAGVSTGDEVIVAAFDYPGNFRSIELVGARPVLVDVAEGSICLDPAALASAASPQVRAVVASHLFGVPAAVQALRAACEERGWILIEDACQVPGMETDGRPIGSFGHLATLSFGGSKLVTAGSGGAVLVSDERLAARLGPLIDRPSDTYPLSPLQAAVIGPQLDRLGEMNRLRSENARFLREQVTPSLSRWNWLSGATHTASAYYKVAWMAQSSQHRQQILAASPLEGLPIGEGYRATSKCSERRCRKPVTTERSERLGQTLFVLDHRALMIEPDQRGELADALIRLHDATSNLHF